MMGNLWLLLKNEITSEMEAQGVTKAELARRLGWQPQAVSRYFGSEETSEPGLDKLAEIANALNIPLVELMKRTTEGQSKKSVQLPVPRDTVILKLIRELMDMNPKELDAIASLVEKIRKKVVTKRRGKK